MRNNRSEHVANVTLAQSARKLEALQVIHSGQGASRASIERRWAEKKREARRARWARVATACAPGGSVGPWLRFAAYAVVVTLAATYGSAHV